MLSTALKDTQLPSPLNGQRVVRPKGKATRRLLVSSLMLTSLVDAFSILVIFLLMSAQTGIEEVQLKHAKELPMAMHVDAISKGIVLTIKDGRYEVDDQPVSERELGTKLEEAKKKAESESGEGKANLLVQADKEMSFEDLSPVLRAGAEAGLHQFKFAVVEQHRKAE